MDTPSKMDACNPFYATGVPLTSDDVEVQKRERIYHLISHRVRSDSPDARRWERFQGVLCWILKIIDDFSCDTANCALPCTEMCTGESLSKCICAAFLQPLSSPASPGSSL